MSTRKSATPHGTFAVVGKGQITVRGDGETVQLLTDNGFVLTLMRAEAMTLAWRLMEECERPGKSQHRYG